MRHMGIARTDGCTDLSVCCVGMPDGGYNPLPGQKCTHFQRTGKLRRQRPAHNVRAFVQNLLAFDRIGIAKLRRVLRTALRGRKVWPLQMQAEKPRTILQIVAAAVENLKGTHQFFRGCG